MELLIFILVIYFLITIFSKNQIKIINRHQLKHKNTTNLSHQISFHKLKKKRFKKKEQTNIDQGSAEKNQKLVQKAILILSLGISLKFVRYVARRIEVRWFVVNER